MTIRKKVLILIGSPKPKRRSASEFLGGLLANSLIARNAEVNVLYLVELKDPRILVDAINRSDTIVFSSPLYIDSTPFIVVRTMDIIKDNILDIRDNSHKGMFVISNCGFPEAGHNKVAVQIYRQFAKEMHFRWLGSFSIGMGPAYIHGYFFRPFRIFRNIEKAMALAAEAIVMDDSIPKDSEDLASRPILPKGLYLFIAVIVLRALAIRNLIFNLSYKPYSRDS